MGEIMQRKQAARSAEDGWQRFFGKPTEIMNSAKQVVSATNAVRGGVAINIRKGVTAKIAALDAETAVLRDQ